MAVHLAFVFGLGAFMITTEGPSAPLDADRAVMMAHVMQALIAVAALVQAGFIARWAWLAALFRRLRLAGLWTDPLTVGDRFLTAKAAREARTSRGFLGGCVVTTVAISWLPEIGYLVQAGYQASSNGYWEPVSDFMMGAVVIFVVVAGAAGLTGGMLKLTER